LAREAAADGLHDARPRFPVEGSDIIPDWEDWQDSVSLPGEQHLASIRFDFDSTDTGMSEKDSTEDSAARSSKNV
jgi:hypothetical protein